MCHLDSPPQSLQPLTPLWDHQNQLWALSCLPSLFSLHHRPPQQHMDCPHLKFGPRCRLPTELL